jgi:ubiquinone/menaquinone biosynthesis C-methylase UbiE
MAMDRPTSSEAGGAWASGDVASGWLRGAAARGQALGPVTELMLDVAGVTVGSRVLDLEAGVGDQTLLAAQRVEPGGAVLATDISASMLGLTREAARAAGLLNVETRVMDAQRLELRSGTFDAAIARFSLQFVPDVRRALTEVRRVLGPGGRFAAVVFSAIEKNPYRAGPQAIASRLAGRPFPEPGPGQWALNEPSTLADAFQRAGFREVEARPVPFVYRFPTLADALRNLEEAQPLLAKLLDELGDADRAAAWAEIERSLRRFVGEDGFAGPSEALLAGGVA